MDKNQIYRSLPNVKTLLEDSKLSTYIEHYGKESVKECVTKVLDQFRALIRELSDDQEYVLDREELMFSIVQAIEQKNMPNMKRVINGTGTILHTNLGRAPLSPKHVRYAAETVSGYSNLEYNLETGKRGERYSHFEKLLCKITGAEAAFAVNNTASAVLLILGALAKDGEAIVSRGELVEIGGKFRIPDVMEQSGVILREVGTTNKTYLEDYEAALTEKTRVFLKVHTSNYKIFGFTKSVKAEELAPLAKEKGILLIEDMGSGAMIDFSRYGLSKEPMVQESIKAGVDVICFSGDKLFGGPQAGIIAGKKDIIAKIKKHPLTRAVRIDKFTATVLEQVMLEYLSEDTAVRNIPVLHMITASAQEVKEKAEHFLECANQHHFPAVFELMESAAQFGGGSMPLEIIPSYAVAITSEILRISQLEKRLRCLPIPVIGRIADNKIVLDMRTITLEEIEILIKEFKEHHVFEAM